MKELKREFPLLLACLASAILIIWGLKGDGNDRPDCNPYRSVCP